MLLETVWRGHCLRKENSRFDINGHTNAKQNGYEATTEIRALETSSRTPIAVTAGILAGEKIKCFESGMDDYGCQL
jgi:CheY-like chemotaxis protein